MNHNTCKRVFIRTALMLSLWLASHPTMAITIVSQPTGQTVLPGTTVTLGIAVDGTDCVLQVPGDQTWVQPPSYFVPQPPEWNPFCTWTPPVDQWTCDPPYCPPPIETTTDNWVHHCDIFDVDGTSYENCSDVNEPTSTWTYPPCDPPYCHWFRISEGYWVGCSVPLPDILVTPPGYWTGSPSLTTQTQLHYQWYTGNLGDTSQPVGGSDSSQVTVTPSVTTAYWAHVTCDGGAAVDTDVATVTVLPPPPIPGPAVNQPLADVPVLYGQTATLTETASGSGPLNYQWFIGSQGDTSQPVGTNGPTFTTSPLISGIQVWVRVTDSIGQSGDSSALPVTVVLPAPPMVQTPTANLPIGVGQTANLTENATGYAPLTYQWYQGAAGNISQPVGNNSGIFMSGPLSNSVPFWVRVTDSIGQSSDSAALTVTVVPVGFSLPVILGCTGTDVTVPFITSGFTGIGSMQATIQWDPTVVTYTGYTDSALPNPLQDDLFGDPASGTLTFAWEDVTVAGATVPDGSILFALNFHLIGAPGSSTPVVVTNVPTPIEVTDANGNILTAALSAGQIQINGNALLAGRVGYYTFNGPVPQVTVQLGGGSTHSTQTLADGSFHLPIPTCVDVTLAPEYDTDVPVDREVTMMDVSAARAHILGERPLTSPFALLAADVNGSQTITAADLRQIRLFILHQRTNFTAQGGSLWRFVPSDYVFPNPTSPWSAPGSRMLTGIAKNFLGQDFLAVKLGDVDGSWDPTPPPGAGVRSLHLAGAPGGPIQLSATRHLVNPGEEVVVAVKSSKVDRLTTAQFTLQWDPAVLEFLGTDGYGLPGFEPENFGQTKVGKGQLYFGWDSPGSSGAALADKQILFQVHFRAVGPGGSASRVSITDTPTPLELSTEHHRAVTETTAGLVAIRAGQAGTLGVVGRENQQLSLWYEAPAGSDWIVQNSFDFVHWTQMTSPTPGPGDNIAILSVPASGARPWFYRAVHAR